jgi:peptidylprolyl isomerase
LPAVRHRAVLVAGLVGLMSLAGCTDRDGAGGESEAAAPDVGDTTARPEVELPGGPVPEGLVIEDLVEGEGEQVAEDTLLTLHYIGVTWSGGEIVSSWERGQPLIYRYGDGRWVDGWTSGLEGMREGGRRQIVVPPEFGYGNRSVPGIPAGETLVFLVDLLEVE